FILAPGRADGPHQVGGGIAPQPLQLLRRSLQEHREVFPVNRGQGGNQILNRVARTPSLHGLASLLVPREGLSRQRTDLPDVAILLEVAQHPVDLPQKIPLCLIFAWNSQFCCELYSVYIGRSPLNGPLLGLEDIAEMAV